MKPRANPYFGRHTLDRERRYQEWKRGLDAIRHAQEAVHGLLLYELRALGGMSSRGHEVPTERAQDLGGLQAIHHVLDGLTLHGPRGG